jgi:exosortase/archaeosortase family protein
MLIVTTLVMAHVLLRSFWRKAVAVSVAVPLSVFKNGLRIFIIAMLGTRVDPSYLTGRLHHQGGVIFLAIALGCTLLLHWLLRRGEQLSLASRLKPLNVQVTGN